MHSKIKGGIGVSKVCSFFLDKEISCFGELFCDMSDYDLIIETDIGLKTIQVRTTTSNNKESADLRLRSITPGTRKSPCIIKRCGKNVDMFALYVKDMDRLLFIDNEDIKKLGNTAVFRFVLPKNNQIKNCRMAEDYATPSFLK